MNNKTKLIFSVLSVLLLVILTVNLVSAYNWVCFEDKEKINFCGNVRDRVCDTDLCKYCMNGYDSVNKCYHYGGWNACNSAPAECTFNSGGGGGGSGGGGNVSIPTIILHNPLNGTVYSTRQVIFDVSLSKKADLLYTDLISGRGRWTSVCNDCSSYSKLRSFNEGENKLMIKAIDNGGRASFKNVTFFIDSKKPVIHKTEPGNGLSNGQFMITYTELNLKQINLNYGNTAKGFKNINLTGCSSGNKQICEIKTNLSVYNGQTIQYYFTVEDRVGNKVSSRSVKLDVDSFSPKINSFVYNLTKTNVKFVFNITEANLESVTYIDSFDSRPMPRRICSGLRKGICESRTSFRKGMHNLAINVTDKAGNIVNLYSNFTIN